LVHDVSWWVEIFIVEIIRVFVNLFDGSKLTPIKLSHIQVFKLDNVISNGLWANVNDIYYFIWGSAETMDFGRY